MKKYSSGSVTLWLASSAEFSQVTVDLLRGDGVPIGCGEAAPQALKHGDLFAAVAELEQRLPSLS